MGIFDRFKNNQKRESTDSMQIKSVQSFYADCLKSFHDEAMKNGFANQGLIFIPELIPMGEKAVLAYLQDLFFTMEFGQNPKQYYYVIMSLSLQTGICFGEKWHKDFAGLKSGYVYEIIKVGPADDANVIMSEIIGISGNQAQNALYQKIYEEWIKCHEPYWKLEDPRQYTFKAMVAAYQLGVSIVLEMYKKY